MSAVAFNLPTKACHNCRKRRWRCDRSLPSCQKCSTAGTECLGYGKLFKWNSGVASRGKMMGKSYDAGREAMEKEAKTRDVPALLSNNEHDPRHQVHPHVY